MCKRIIIISIYLITCKVAFGQFLQEKTSTASRVRLNVSNLGTFGNAFRGYRDGTGHPSCEFPAGSGVEHMFESGFWFGGIVNGEELVSTSAVDASQGFIVGQSGYEFTTENQLLEERSSIPSSPFFSNSAVSHQDFVSFITDSNTIVPGTAIPILDHSNPLFIEVKTESYNWNFPHSDFFVVLNFTLFNHSPFTVEDAYFSFWANNVVRNINSTPPGQGGAAFYNKGGNGYIDSLSMAYTFDHSGDIGFTDSYVAQKFLGAQDKFGFHHPDIDSAFNQQTGQFYKDEFESTYNAWIFNSLTDSIFFSPSNDLQRYLKQMNGLNENQCWNQNSSSNPSCNSQSLQEQLKLAGNRSDLVSVGPFKNFNAGDSINVTFAIVLAEKNEDGLPNAEDTRAQKKFLFENASKAQLTYNGEDINFNGILDANEDFNGDGKLTRYLPTESPLNISKIQSNHEIVIHQNKGSLYVKNLGQEVFDGTIRIIDLTGKVVFSKSSNLILPNQSLLIQSRLFRGIYILEATNINGSKKCLRFFNN